MKNKLLILGSATFVSLPILVVSCSNSQENKNIINIEFKSELNNIPLGNKAVSPSTINVEWIKERVVQNINMIFNITNGDQKLFDWENNVAISDVNANDENGTLTFTCSIKSKNLQSKVTFVDFKSNKPTQPELTLNSAGGQFNSLSISHYLTVIKNLNLNVDTQLSSLSDQDLTNKIQKIDEYQNLTIKILDGSSEKNGILKLSLNGNYNNQPIDSQINVTGFSNYDTRFDIGNLELDLEKYFDNKQPIVEKSDLALTNELEIKKSLIKKLDFYFNDNYVNSLSYNEMLQKYNLKNIEIKKEKNNKLKFSFDFETKFQEYKNNQWTLDQNQKSLQQNSARNSEFNMPTLNTLMKFMLNKFTFDESSLSNYYPSVFKGLFMLSVKTSTNLTGLLDFIKYEEIIEKYQDTYFNKNQIIPKLDLSYNEALEANDYTNSLSFTINLINTSKPRDFTVNRRFESNKLKNINNLLETDKNVVNVMTIKNDNNSSMAKILKKTFKTEIDKLFTDSKEQELELQTTKLLNYLSSSFSLVYNFENSSNYDDAIKKVNNNYMLSLFNKDLSDDRFNEHQGQFGNNPQFDLSSGLLSLDGTKEKAFFVESISYDFNESSLKPYIKMTSNTNVVTIRFSTIVSMNISGKSYEQQANFSLTITKSQWEAENKSKNN